MENIKMTRKEVDTFNDNIMKASMGNISWQLVRRNTGEVRFKEPYIEKPLLNETNMRKEVKYLREELGNENLASDDVEAYTACMVLSGHIEALLEIKLKNLKYKGDK